MGTLASPWWDTYTSPSHLNQKSCVLSSVGAGWVWMMGGGACAALVDVPAACGYLRRVALVDVPAPCWVLTSRRPGGCTRALLGTYVAPPWWMYPRLVGTYVASPWWMYPRPVGYLRRAALVDVPAPCWVLTSRRPGGCTRDMLGRLRRPGGCTRALLGTYVASPWWI